MLDARGVPPPAKEVESAEAETIAAEDAEVAALLRETRIWRLANSAQWVAWGIVQAKVAGMPDFSPQTSGTATPTASTQSDSTADVEEHDAGEAQMAGSAHHGTLRGGEASDPLDAEAQGLREDLLAKRPDPNEEGDEAETEDAEFDYLAYARSRAMFFWGDALELGIVEEKDLPKDVLASVLRVGY